MWRSTPPPRRGAVCRDVGRWPNISRVDDTYRGFVNRCDSLGAKAYWVKPKREGGMGGVPLLVRIAALVAQGEVDFIDATEDERLKEISRQEQARAAAATCDAPAGRTTADDERDAPDDDLIANGVRFGPTVCDRPAPPAATPDRDGGGDRDAGGGRSEVSADAGCGTAGGRKGRGGGGKPARRDLPAKRQPRMRRRKR